MTDEREKPDCYKCLHKRDIPGDAHIMCAHPATNLIGPEDVVAALKDYMAGRHEGFQQAADKLHIAANYHGVKAGWFRWPFDFDPTWLLRCEGYTPADKEAEE